MWQSSTKGKRARAPKWWLEGVDKLPKARLPWLKPKKWDRATAQAWVDRIPSKCPFERQLWWGDRLVLYIPPLCPLNPVSAQLYEIRIEAQAFLSGLADKEKPGPPPSAV
jgi:hypothetical protein